MLCSSLLLNLPRRLARDHAAYAAHLVDDVGEESVVEGKVIGCHAVGRGD